MESGGNRHRSCVMNDKKSKSYVLPVVLAVVAVCFYVLSIVMQYLNNGAS